MLRVRRALSGAVTVAVLSVCLPAFADVPSCLAAAERAQSLRRAGELRQARAQLISCSAPSCPRAGRLVCSRWLAEVESAQPSLVVQARDASGADLADVTVAIDGVVQQHSLEGLAIPVDPGTRTLRFEAPGRDAAQQTLVVREGEKNRVVPVVLARHGELAKPKPPPSAPVTLPVAAPPPERAGTPVGAFLVGGAGLLAVGGGVVFWARGVGERNDLRDQCASAASCVSGDIDAAKTKLVVGDVLVGAGVLALAASLWMALRSSPPSSSAVTVGPLGAASQLAF
jgi:hypothetical protein